MKVLVCVGFIVVLSGPCPILHSPNWGLGFSSVILNSCFGIELIEMVLLGAEVWESLGFSADVFANGSGKSFGSGTNGC